MAMADINKVPNDIIDLSVLAVSYDNALGTLYPLAYVYGPDNQAVSNSPFSLDYIGNNLYAKNGAFQADVDSGTYKVIYEFYEDEAHTIKSSQIGQSHDTITISTPYSSGLGSKNIGGAIYYDDSALRKLFFEELKKTRNALRSIKKKIENIELKEAEQVDLSSLETRLGEIYRDMPKEIGKDLIDLIIKNQAFNKNWFKNLMDAIKKNRTTIIKSRFDKAMMKPVFEGIGNIDIRLDKRLSQMKNDLTATIDLRKGESEKQFIKLLNGALIEFASVASVLDDNVRKKLKFAISELKALVVKPKDVKIILKTDKL